MINDLLQLIEGKSIEEQIKAIADKFSGEIVFSTSFQFEDQVITDIIFSNDINVNIFTLDTGRHFEETYKTFNKTIKRYKKGIDVYFPKKESVEDMLTKKGPYSFYDSVENRKECCNIRKVEPLERALKDKKCWITGLRQGQSNARTEVPLIEWDEKYQLYKFNPVLNWTMEQIKEHITNNNVPYNVMHDKGFPSIGCAPCTRAIADGEDTRAGRWWWENNTKKECGLHVK